jgi:hypothetical protein
MPRKKIRKLYVWEDVLKDYFPGLVVVLAYSLPQAIRVAVKTAYPPEKWRCSPAPGRMREELKQVSPTVTKLDHCLVPVGKGCKVGTDADPKVKCWYVHGGG